MGCKVTTIKSLNNNSEELKYVIFFKKSDFFERTFFKNKVQQCEKIAYQLAGKYKSISITDFNKYKIKMQDEPLLYTLYIRTEEDIWVSAEKYTEICFQQMIIESLEALAYLGAKEITFTTLKLTSQGIKANANLNVKMVEIGGDVEMSNNQNTELTGNVIIKEQHNNQYKDINDFFSKHKFNHIYKSIQWINQFEILIYNKLELLDFKYVFNQNSCFDARIKVLYDNIGINVGINKKDLNEILIKYKVKF